MLGIIVAENVLRNAAVPDALYHRCVVSRIRKYVATYNKTKCILFDILNFVKKIWSFNVSGEPLPGSALASVNKVESLATKQLVNKSAACFWCNLASVISSFSWNIEFPEMFLVPPAPLPNRSKASLQITKAKLHSLVTQSIKYRLTKLPAVQTKMNLVLLNLRAMVHA